MLCERVNAEGWSLAKEAFVKLKRRKNTRVNQPPPRVNAIEIHTPSLEIDKKRLQFSLRLLSRKPPRIELDRTGIKDLISFLINCD